MNTNKSIENTLNKVPGYIVTDKASSCWVSLKRPYSYGVNEHANWNTSRQDEVDQLGLFITMSYPHAYSFVTLSFPHFL